MTSGTLAATQQSRYVLRHADDNVVIAQRLAEWSAHAPELEEDIALTNLALDFLGQARHLYQHAASLEGAGRSEDDLAFRRTEQEFTNLLLVEQPNGDFARTMARQLFYDAYQLLLYQGLQESIDRTLGGIAAKALKEARYHFRHSSGWVIRLGDGTAESHLRMQAGVDAMWRFTGEMLVADDLALELTAQGIAVGAGDLEAEWNARIDAVLTEATLDRPSDPYQRTGGRHGFHTEHLGHMLGEMQWMQRTYPGLDW